MFRVYAGKDAVRVSVAMFIRYFSSCLIRFRAILLYHTYCHDLERLICVLAMTIPVIIENRGHFLPCSNCS